MLKLRPLEPEDLALLYELENDSELWCCSSEPVPSSRFMLREYIARAESLIECRQQRFAIDDIDEQPLKRQTVGFIDLTNYDPLSLRGEVSITIRKEARRKGYGSQALPLFETTIKKLVPIRLLYAIIAERNESSRKLFERAEYQDCGRLPQWQFDGVSFCDCRIYSKILRKNQAHRLVE